MSSVFIDVTDLVEFLERQESVSGVQRVVVEVAPLLVGRSHAVCVLLDRSRGVFVELTEVEKQTLIDHGVRNGSTHDRVILATVSSQCLERARNADSVEFNDDAILVFLGALWINDALMIAARAAHATGARIVSLLYDLTPILDAGHTAAVNNLFYRYLHLLLQCASRVPAISQSSRHDFEQYAKRNGTIAPPGSPTGLPCGLSPEGRDLSERPWPRPYVLFVGTVESRKNHLLAFRAWQQLIERHGEDSIPDLVCIGRLGWNSAAFLREYVFTHGLNGKLSVLSSSVDDRELAAFYNHSEFTIYPSNYEGWGLPVSESLAFGKLPVVARNSSLPEAGRDLAVYFETGNEGSLVEAVETHALDPRRRQELEERIRTTPRHVTSWDDVARIMGREIDAADRRDPVFPTIELGREYMLSVGEPPPDEGYADQYLDHLVREGLTPMLSQPRGELDYETTDAAVIGTFGSPQTWGLEIRPGRHAEFRVTRPVDGRLTLLVATRPMPGRATIQVSGPGGPVFDDVYLGSVISIPLGDGRSGEPAQGVLSVTAADDSIEGFLGIRSFVVLEESDKEGQIVVLQAAATALRQELDFIQGTRSWKVTAPLRKWKGRGA
jgi:glycosyltransferase involved in cell wall biosynthesis